MKLVRAVASALSTLVLAGLLVALAVAPAGAKPKPEFKPVTGTYAGTMTSPAGTGTLSGQVGMEGKKYVIQALISTTQTCENGETLGARARPPRRARGGRKPAPARPAGSSSRSSSKPRNRWCTRRI